MKFSISKPALDSILADLSLTAMSRGDTPMTCVHIVAAAAKDTASVVTFRTTNLEATAIARTGEVSVEADGEIMVSISMLQRVAASMEVETIAIETVPSGLQLTSDYSKATILCPPADRALPPQPEVSNKSVMVLTSAAKLIRAINRTAFACSTVAGRYAFTGFAIIPGKPARLAATDGRQLAATNADFDLKIDVPPIVPASAQKSIISVLKNAGDGQATLTIDDHFLSVQTDDREYFTSLLQGTFPPIDDVVSKECVVEGLVAADELRKVLKSSMVFADVDNNGAWLQGSTMRLEIKSGQITITGKSAISGHSYANAASAIKGPDIAIGINPRFLNTFLNTVEDDEIRISMLAPNRPIVVRDTDREYVLMPINFR